ncbi:MAG: branched-chain amino acid ABC transporter permease [Aigarchaeota archaeon]|nr:branched-chain amino acid ABC transporter permease [Candidatus Pelearchaeum maunauluense]
MAYEIALIYVISIIFYASVLFLISSGLNLIYGVMRILNLAHGGLYAFGAYVGAWFIAIVVGSQNPFLLFLAPLTGAAIAALLGLFIEPSLLKPIYGRREEYQLLLTFGVLLMLEDGLRAIWGSAPLTARAPFVLMGNVNLLGYSYPLYNLVVVAVSLLTALALWFYINKTRNGVIIRATSTDREMAAALGVDVKRVYLQTFVIASFMAGLAGALIVPTTTAVLGMSVEALVLAFVVIVIGGLGSLKGAFFGSLLVGAARIVGINYFPQVELVLLYAVASIILITRSKGLFGR